MTMSRRDLVVIAEAIRHHLDAADDAGDAGAVLVIDALAKDLADRIGGLTLSFDRERFLSACGLKDGSNADA